jgi:hypothetical protein
MPVSFVLDNQQHRLSDALNGLLAQSVGKPLDIATAYFAISGYRLVKEGLHQVGAFRLLLGAEPHSPRRRRQADNAPLNRLSREDLEQICFEYVSGDGCNSTWMIRMQDQSDASA